MDKSLEETLDHLGRRLKHKDQEIAHLSNINGFLTQQNTDCIEIIAKLRSLVVSMLENDPSDMAADATTVLDVWRKEAKEVLKKL